MALLVLRAFVVALVSTGAAGTRQASTEHDQIDIESAAQANQSVAQANRGILGAFMGMLGSVELDSTLRRELGLRRHGSATPGQCVQQDMEKILAKAEFFMGKVRDNVGTDAVLAMLPEDCQHMMVPGTMGLVPDFHKMGSCMGSALDVSTPCNNCVLYYFTGVTDVFVGCLASCTPFMSACSGADTSQAGADACFSALRTCMKCDQPHFKKMAHCIGGDPIEPALLRKMVELQDKVVGGHMTTAQATKAAGEFREAFEKQGEQIGEHLGIKK